MHRFLNVNLSKTAPLRAQTTSQPLYTVERRERLDAAVLISDIVNSRCESLAFAQNTTQIRIELNVARIRNTYLSHNYLLCDRGTQRHHPPTEQTQQ